MPLTHATDSRNEVRLDLDVARHQIPMHDGFLVSFQTQSHLLRKTLDAGLSFSLDGSHGDPPPAKLGAQKEYFNAS